MHCLIQGRNKKGIIFTFAAGNGGDDDTCAANGYVNSIYTISVGAVGINGIPAYYDEICSAKLVSGYVENLDDNFVHYQMWCVLVMPVFCCPCTHITCHMNNAAVITVITPVTHVIIVACYPLVCCIGA